MTTTRYRKKPVEVDTIQWTGSNEAEIIAFTGNNFYALDDTDRENSDDPEATAAVYDRLHSTWVLVYTGQHVVRGVKGEYYPIAEDVLAETYEPVGDATPATGATEPATATAVAALTRLYGPMADLDHPQHPINATQPADSPLLEQIAAAIAQANLPMWHKAARYEAAAAALSVVLPHGRVAAALYRSAEDTVTRVIGLHEQWVKAGPPPLGASLARWWDARLVELHNAIQRPTREQRERPTHPDGTPYRHHEIKADGWEHCDGCRLWGQGWTAESPHQCTNDRVQPADHTTE